MTDDKRPEELAKVIEEPESMFVELNVLGVSCYSRFKDGGNGTRLVQEDADKINR